MVLSLTYKRPSWVSIDSSSVSEDEKSKSLAGSMRSGSSSHSAGVPGALSFDRIISGGTCPPCTTIDFLNYMKYISHDAENLQFYLWYRDYTKRFDALPESEKALSPVWSAAQADADANAVRKSGLFITPAVAAVFVGTDFAKRPEATTREIDPFGDDAHSPSLGRRDTLSSGGSTAATHETIAAKATETFETAGMQWTPFTAQPFRQELDRIIGAYIADDAPRQLNLSARERTALLHGLQHTTHPSALAVAANSVEYTLRYQSHPNFIRWAICNGNRPRVIFARGLGVGTILLALVADVILALSHAGRGWRAVPLVGYVLGVATLFAAWNGMCVVLHGLHHRHVRPWELFSDCGEEKGDELDGNSYEDEPWVGKYQKRNLVRKVFDREVWIQEPALRQIQDTVFVQSILCALIIGAVMVGIFCAVPRGGYF